MIKARHDRIYCGSPCPSKHHSFPNFTSYHIIEFDLSNPYVYATKWILKLGINIGSNVQCAQYVDVTHEELSSNRMACKKFVTYSISTLYHFMCCIFMSGKYVFVCVWPSLHTNVCCVIDICIQFNCRFKCGILRLSWNLKKKKKKKTFSISIKCLHWLFVMTSHVHTCAIDLNSYLWDTPEWVSQFPNYLLTKFSRCHIPSMYLEFSRLALIHSRPLICWQLSMIRKGTFWNRVDDVLSRGDIRLVGTGAEA